MDKPLKMLSPSEMMDLILQSVEESNLFRSEWDKEFVRIVLEIALVKGDFIHFVNYYSNKVDVSNFESFFKSYIVNKHGEDFFYVLRDKYFGVGNE